MMAIEIFTNQPQTTVLTGGLDAPASGTVEAWTVANASIFPQANSGGLPPTEFHVIDTATGATSEIIAVTNVSGGTWTVTRGAEGSTPVTHSAGFLVVQAITAGSLTSFLQSLTNADASIAVSGPTATPVLSTGTLNQIASAHPPTASVVMNSQKLTGLAKGVAATDAANISQLPGWYNVKNYGAAGNGTTDDTTAIQAAITACMATGGTVYLPTGTYLVSSTLTVSTSGVYMQGDGLWATFINFTGTGDCLRWYDASTYTSRTVHGGGPVGLSINIGSAGTSSTALHAGDILEFVFEISVEGSGSTSSIGIHMDNANYWSEQDRGIAYIDSCTQDVVFDCTGATTSNGSYDRGDFTFYLSHKTFAGNCITFQNGAFMVGGRLRIYGNINSSSSSFTQSILQITGSAPGGHAASTSNLTNIDLQINVESDEALAHTFQTINFGSSSNLIFDCSGNISFGAGNQFATSNVSSTTTQFVFLGPVVGDSTLAAQCIINRVAIFSTSSFFGIPTFQAPLLIDNHAAPSTPSAAGYVYVDTSSNLHYLGAGGGDTTLARSTAAPAASVSFTPANPVQMTNQTTAMVGLGTACAFTPRTTGSILATFTGLWNTATAATTGVLSCRYGTSTPPTNGAAVTGTRWGTGTSDPFVNSARSTSASMVFNFTQVITGLTPATGYWFDIITSTSASADPAVITNITASFIELAS